MELPQLYTASYSDFDPAWGVPVRTSVGEPKWWPEPLAHLRRVAPYGLREVTDQDEFARLYFERLDNAGPEAISDRLIALSATHQGRPLVLLCFEDLRRPGAWCHRRLLAAWIERNLCFAVPELTRQPSLLDA